MWSRSSSGKDLYLLLVHLPPTVFPPEVGAAFLLCRLSSVAQTSAAGVLRRLDSKIMIVFFPMISNRYEVKGEEMVSQAERNRTKVAEIIGQFQREDGDTGSTLVQGACSVNACLSYSTLLLQWLC